MALLCIVLTTATTAFAATGWYLLIPLISDFDEYAPYLQGYKILDAKPLSQWAQQGSYDSAAECEATKNALLLAEQGHYSLNNEDYIKALGSHENPTTLKFMRWTTEKANANVDALTASRCIKSDDPRLGE